MGIAFYDHRNDKANNPPKDTDYWLRTSHDGGATWQETLLAGSFDETTAPSTDTTGLPGGPGFVGDYQGPAALDNGFAASFALAAPLPGANFKLANPPTDVFFSRIAR